MLYDSVCTYLFSVVKESPPHTRWSGGMEDLRREKWIRDEKYVSGRGECVCAKLCGLGGEDVADLRFELGAAQRNRIWSWVCRTCSTPAVSLKNQERCLGLRSSEGTEEKLV